MLVCLFSACSAEVETISVPQFSTFDPSSDCVDLNKAEISTNHVPERLIAVVMEDARSTADNANIYKVIRGGDSNSEAQIVFALEHISDVYIVYVVDLSGGTILRKFTLGSLHYTPTNVGCRQLAFAGRGITESERAESMNTE